MAKPRPRLVRVSEEMKAWSAMLAGEIARWPAVTTKPMFGFTAFYRKSTIFAVLPKTRGMNSPNSLAFKIPSATARQFERLRHDARIGETEMQKTHWFSFVVQSEADLQGALAWLSEAYEAGKTKNRNKPKARPKT